MIRRLIGGKHGMSELRIAGCSGTERCVPIRRVTTGASPRPIATLTVNAASACESRRLRYGEAALESPRPLIAPQPPPPARSGASPFKAGCFLRHLGRGVACFLLIVASDLQDLGPEFQALFSSVGTGSINYRT